MDIKVGDIVTIRGKAQRVTSIGRYGIVLSSFGLFSRDRFENYMNMFKGVIDIEHITLPQLNVGDWVVVNSIPSDERRNYCLVWWPENNKYIGKIWPVTNIRDTELCGQIVTLGGGREFHTYHLEKIDDYDIV